MSTFDTERAAATGTPLPICTFNPEAHDLERFMGPLEAVIMETVWSAARPMAVKATWKILRTEYRNTIAYTTIMTTMGRLHTKGFLERRKNDIVYYYTPRETRDAFEDRQAEAILKSLGRNA